MSRRCAIVVRSLFDRCLEFAIAAIHSPSKGQGQVYERRSTWHSEGEIVMRHWLPEPRILNVLIRSGISIGPEDGGPYQPLWRSELRKQLQEKPHLTASL